MEKDNNFAPEEEKKSWKDKLHFLKTKKDTNEEKDEQLVEITSSKAKKLLIKSILWGVLAVLSFAFGITSIVYGVDHIKEINTAFTDGKNWKGAVKILTSISQFVEAGLFIFFIIYSSIKSIFYFSPYWNWKKSQSNNKKESKFRKLKEKELRKQARNNK